MNDYPVGAVRVYESPDDAQHHIYAWADPETTILYLQQGADLICVPVDELEAILSRAVGTVMAARYAVAEERAG